MKNTAETELRRIAHEIACLETRLRYIVEQGKHAAYVKAEFVEIEDKLMQLGNDVHMEADAVARRKP